MPAAALAIPILGTVVSAVSSKKAAKAQTQSADQAIAEQQRQFQETQAAQSPFQQAGTAALARLQDPNAFQASPGYQFARAEGQRGIENSFAARSGAASGNALRALTEFNQGLASQEYGNWWNREAGLAGIGQQSTNALGAMGARTSDNIGNLQMGRGDARASGIAGVGNALLYGGEQAYGGYLNNQRTKTRSPYGYQPPKPLKPGQGVMQASTYQPWARGRRS